MGVTTRPARTPIVEAMTATIIDGRAIAARVRAEVRAEIDRWVSAGHPRPALATVLVGEDPASAIYVANKQKACTEVGIEGLAHDLPSDSSQDDVAALLHELNEDDRVAGILLQLPTPPPIDGSALTTLIDAAKDVDGLTPISTGLLTKGLPGLRPCTPAGCIELLRRHEVALEGAEAVILGRSDLVGRPVAALLLAENATVTICHSRTRDLPAVCRRADVLIAAVGRPEMVRGDWIKPGAAVIDVGINRTDAGLVGDVHFPSAQEVAGLITPVPGGVGPMTIAMLMRNTLTAAQAQATRAPA
jgi:methylenetetrahydrofolate dehydrogenase (NADP+)/methenyltetrahydrofolate cyclohydrolase